MLTNPPVPYDFCVVEPISHLVAAFNQEKALVGAFSVIVVEPMEHYTALVTSPGPQTKQINCGLHCRHHKITQIE